jgi:addiction module HigA family antidote
MESLRNKKMKPRHPGELIKTIILPELEITQNEFAEELGVSRRTVNELLNEHRPVSQDMAIRLSRLIGNSPGFWLRMQQAVDLWLLEHSDLSRYANIKKFQSANKKKAS